MNTLTASLIVLIATIHLARGGETDDFECSERGRFADETNCRQYYSCRLGYGGQWQKSKFDCPDGTVFDQDAGHCSSTASCSSESSSSSDSSSDSSSSDSSSSDENGEYNCKKPGLFEDSNDPTCCNYYECKYQHGELFSVRRPCPPPSKFNPKTKHCSKTYTCTKHFKCTKVGRFDDETDENNKRYFLCVKKKNGVFVQTIYSCPLYSRFDAIDHICVIPNESLSDEEEVHDHTLPNEDWDAFSCPAKCKKYLCH